MTFILNYFPNSGVAHALANNPTVKILNLKMCTHLDETVFVAIAENLKGNLVSSLNLILGTDVALVITDKHRVIQKLVRKLRWSRGST